MLSLFYAEIFNIGEKFSVEHLFTKFLLLKSFHFQKSFRKLHGNVSKCESKMFMQVTKSSIARNSTLWKFSEKVTLGY